MAAAKLQNPEYVSLLLTAEDFPPHEPWMSDIFIILKRDSHGVPDIEGLEYVERFGPAPPRWGGGLLGTRNLAWSITAHFYNDEIANKRWKRLYTYLRSIPYSGDFLFFSRVNRYIYSFMGIPLRVGQKVKSGKKTGPIRRIIQNTPPVLRIIIGAQFLAIALSLVLGAYGDLIFSIIFTGGAVIAILWPLLPKIAQLGGENQNGDDPPSRSMEQILEGEYLLLFRRDLIERGFDEHFLNASGAKIGVFINSMSGLDAETIATMPYYSDLAVVPTFMHEYPGFSLRMSLERVLRYRALRSD